MATVNQLNTALQKSGLDIRAAVSDGFCYIEGTDIRVAVEDMNEMTLPQWVNAARKSLRASKSTKADNHDKLQEDIRILRYQISDAKRTGDNESAKELQEALEATMGRAKPKPVTAAAKDSLARADVLQKALTKQLHIDTGVDEAERNFVLVTMPHPVPLPSIIIALSKANMTPVESSSRQRIKHGSDVVLSYSIPSQQMRLLIFLDTFGSVSVMGVI